MREKSVEVKQKRKKKYCDYSLLLLVIFMVCFGLIMLYSTTAYSASIEFNDPMYFLKKQLFGVAMGVLAIVFLGFIVPTELVRKLAIPAYVVAIILQILVLFVGDEINGSRRWLNIMGFSFQPAELTRIATIIFVAYLICRGPKNISKFWQLLKITILSVLGAIAIAIDNFSTAFAVVLIVIVIEFVASPKFMHFIYLGCMGLAAAGVFLLLQPYRIERIKAWITGTEAADVLDSSYQTMQGLYAIGSGGLMGKGLGESVQKLHALPEAENDMIFSIICEELGVFGAVCVILLFVLIIWRLMVIANNASTLYGTLVVVGVMAHISINVILNIAVVTNTIPNTGIALPFISYGGTSIMFLMAEIGIALGVSRSIEFEEE